MRTLKRLAVAFVGLAVVWSAAAAAPTSTPPPTPVPPRNSPSPYPTVLITPRPSLTPPRITARAALLEDVATGQVLYGKHPDQRRAVASTTKIMTALIALRRSRLSADATVSPEAADQPGSDMDLKSGEVISVRNLLYGMLLSSANDASVATAEEVAGTVPRFVKLMNRRARSMRLSRTHFASPSGLNDKGYSTARDMATLTRDAYRSPVFASITATKTVDIPSPSGRIRHLQNRNALLWLYPGTYGVKTGFTARAGWCLIAAARRGGRRLVAVVLGSATQDWSFFDAAALLNYGFREFKRTMAVSVGQTVGALTISGVPVPSYSLEAFTLLLRRDLVGHITFRLRPGLHVSLPVNAGEALGTAVIIAGHRGIGSVLIAAVRPVAAPAVPVATQLRMAATIRDVWNLLGAVASSTVGTFL